MSSIHPTAIVAAGATIDPGARIGPWCSIGPNVTIAEDVELVSHVVVDGHTSIGPGAILYPFCTVGLAPQDLKYRGEPTGCEIGARTQIREHVTIHRGTVTGVGTTRVGADCLLMAVAHVAHDCQLGTGIVIANNVVMGGHVSIGDRAVIGGSAAIHQFVRVGRSAMVGGVSGVEADVIPFGSVTGNRARLSGLNIIGLKRRGYDRDEVHALRAAFNLLFRGPGVFADRMQDARHRYDRDTPAETLVREVLDFIDQPSKRGLIRTGKIALDDDEL